MQTVKAWAEETTSMSVVAANVTDEKREKIFIRQDLPDEIAKEDVLDPGGLEIRYDEEKSIYYLYTEVDLEPQASKKFKVVLRDKWKVPQTEASFLKDQVDQRLEALKGKESYGAGQMLRNAVVSQIDEIMAEEEANKGNIQKKIDLYRVHIRKLNEIRQKISIQDDFTREAQRFVDGQKTGKFIKFTIEAENSSENESAENVEITRYLPEGVTPDQINDLKGFEMKYDREKSLYFLTNTVNLKPLEVKKFEILISQDSLIISDMKLDELQTTETFTPKLAGTGYEKEGAYLSLEIKKLIDEIKNTQKNSVTAEDKIAAYTANLRRLDTIKENLEKLRRLVEAADKAKAKKLTEIIKTVTPDVATTWKIIYATIAFLTVISVFFYFLWWGQAKAKQNQKFEDVKITGKEK